MNDYCLNQSQGLNTRQHTSTYNKYPANYHHFPTPTTPHPPAFPSAPGCIPHKPKKKMKHEHKLSFSFVSRYYLIFLFWQKQTNILKVEPEISWTTTYMKRESEKE